MCTEADRLKDLLDLQILDTGSEAQFNEIVELAAEICQTPIALMSLVDENRVWYKAQVGYGQKQDPRTGSLCDQVVATRSTLLVENVHKDNRFKSSPVVKLAPRLHFYAGVPLTTSKGNSIGALCVVDEKPRILSGNQLQAMERLSRNTVRLMELRRQNLDIKNLALEIAQKEILLIESAKMSSLGQMAGGIAHEINNPLMIISLYCTKLKDLAGSGQMNPETLIAHADKIQETAMRIARIIRGLREFCGDGDKDPMKVVSIQRIIEDTLSFCHEKKLRMGVKFKLNQPQEQIDIECRPILISQVLLNLMNNACDALTEKSEKLLEVEVKDEREWVTVSVFDNGHGIPREIHHQIFHPFFTTKEVGQGIGLGLSISKGIAESHGGSLTFESANNGTKFVLRIPKSQIPNN